MTTFPSESYPRPDFAALRVPAVALCQKCRRKTVTSPFPPLTNPHDASPPPPSQPPTEPGHQSRLCLVPEQPGAAAREMHLARGLPVPPGARNRRGLGCRRRRTRRAQRRRGQRLQEPCAPLTQVGVRAMCCARQREDARALRRAHQRVGWCGCRSVAAAATASIVTDLIVGFSHI